MGDRKTKAGIGARECVCGCDRPVPAGTHGPYATEMCRRAERDNLVVQLRAKSDAHTLEIRRAA